MLTRFPLGPAGLDAGEADGGSVTLIPRFSSVRILRKTGRPRTRWVGVALRLYFYAISATWLLYAVGGALCVALQLDRGCDMATGSISNPAPAMPAAPIRRSTSSERDSTSRRL